MTTPMTKLTGFERATTLSALLLPLPGEGWDGGTRDTENIPTLAPYSVGRECWGTDTGATKHYKNRSCLRSIYLDYSPKALNFQRKPTKNARHFREGANPEDQERRRTPIQNRNGNGRRTRLKRPAHQPNRPATGADANPGLRFNTDGKVVSTYTGDQSYFQNLPTYYTTNALSRQAIAPLWEADTARLQDKNNLNNSGLSELERAANLGHLAGAKPTIAAGVTEKWNPIALNFGGGLATRVLSNTSVRFNADGNAELDARLQGNATQQYLHRTEWLNGTDGFLVLDKNVNGVIDDAEELFSNSAVAAGHYRKRSCQRLYLLGYRVKTYLKTSKNCVKVASIGGKKRKLVRKLLILSVNSGCSPIITSASSYEKSSDQKLMELI